MNSEDEFNDYLKQLQQPSSYLPRNYLIILPLLGLLWLLFNGLATSSPMLSDSNIITLQLQALKVFLPLDSQQLHPCSIHYQQQIIVPRAKIKPLTSNHYLLQLSPADYHRLQPLLSRSEQLEILPITPKETHYEITF